MKFNVLLAVAVQAAGVLSVALPDAETRCGDLGVMEVPEGADASEYRQCRDHPLGHLRRRDSESSPGPSLEITRREPNAAEKAGLVERDCWWGEPTGCTDGYCWKTCDTNGEWCWTALNQGTGPWYKCTASSQCYEYMDCGGDCSC